MQVFCNLFTWRLPLYFILQFLQVILDVKDFADGELDLKSDGEVLTVTGSKGGTTFKREFSLPGLAAPEQVTASLSEDGVLTVTAPRA